MKTKPMFIAVLTALFAWTSLAGEPDASLAFSFARTDDGSCEKTIPDVSGEFSYDADQIIVYGNVRTGASGGDCRQESLSYNVETEYHFELNETWSAVTKFAADKRSTSSTYALAENGQTKLRDDGNAYFPTTLPAGAAETIGAYLGISRTVNLADGELQIDLAGNIVPVDWADDEDGRAVHLALAFSREVLGGEIDLAVAVDSGADTYGDARLSFRRGLVQFGVEYAFGLNAVDDGAESLQHVNGAPFLKQGSPQDDSLTTSIGITFDL